LIVIAFFTVTLYVAVFPPRVAVMLAVPAALAVTTPLESTVATFVLLDFHVTVPSRFVVALRVVDVLP
jgi:hypothetical protein